MNKRFSYCPVCEKELVDSGSRATKHGFSYAHDNNKNSRDTNYENYYSCTNKCIRFVSSSLLKKYWSRKRSE